MEKNVAGQSIGAEMVSASDGSAFTGTVTVYYTIDNGTQTIGSVGSGVCTHEGNGYHSYAPTQGETNGDHIAWTFIGTGAIPATIQVYTVPPMFNALNIANGAADSYVNGFLNTAITETSAGRIAGNFDTFWDNANSATSNVVDDVGAIKTKTDFLPSATAGAAGGVFIAGTNAATTITTALTTTFTGNLTGSVGSVTGHTPQTGDSFARIGAAGAGLTNINLPNQVMDITGNLTGNVSGSVGSVTGAVGSVTAAVTLANGAHGGAAASITLADYSDFQGAAGDPWATALPGAYGAGTAGEILGDWKNGGRLDLLLDDIPNVSEFEARTLVAGEYFDPDTDIVANVTEVATLTGNSAAGLVDLIWDEDVDSTHQTAGTAGKKLDDAGGAADPWSTALPGAYGAGTAGEIIGDWKDAGRLDALLDAVKAKTDFLPSVTPGDANGLFIAGTNAATTITTALTTTFTGNLTGSVGSNLELGPAEVNAEVDTALADINLDHLLAVADADDVVDNSVIAHLASATGDWSTFDDATDSMQAIRDRGDAEWVTGAGGSPPTTLQSTTIATLATQVSFTLTAGSADDDAYNGMLAVITDSATSTQKAVGVVSDYTGSTKTITLRDDPGVFTMAVGDTIDIVANDDVLTKVNAALDTAISELSQAIPTATPTIRTGLMLMYMALRNKLVVDTTTTDILAIYNDAGTMIAKKTLTDDGTIYTEAEMVAGT